MAAYQIGKIVLIYRKLFDLSLISLCPQKGLVSLTEKISSYDPNQRNVLKEGTYENVKNFIDGNAVYDAPLPSYLPVFSVLQCWLQRALTARENAITYFREATEEDMEVVIP